MALILPVELGAMVNDYAKPIGLRVNWRREKSPSCIAIHKSDEFRDFRTTVICGGSMGMEDVCSDTTWDEWCYWNAILMRPRYVSIDEMIRTGIDPDYVPGMWSSNTDDQWFELGISGESWLNSL